jgi:hypothetical protein
MMNRITLLTLTCMLAATTAHAGDTAPEQRTAVEPTPSSTATRAWLDLQSSGQEASKKPQPLSGEVLDKIHERYIDSFSKPIPEHYEHESFTDN